MNDVMEFINWLYYNKESKYNENAIKDASALKVHSGISNQRKRGVKKPKLSRI